MTTEIERRTLRRISWRIVPFIMLLYFIAYIDRVNVGFASLTMNKDLGFTASILGFGSGLFFLGYFLFEVPSNLILQKVGARVWIARVMLTWGVLAGAGAFVEGARSFYVLRFLLGAAEAGFFPGIILYLSYWFPARHRAFVTSFFMAAVPISTAIGSPASAYLLQLNGVMGLAGWQWLFILEALPALILGIAVLYVMTDRPEQAAWLKDDERAWLVSTMNEEAARKAAYAEHSIIRGLADPRVLILAVIYFGTSAGLYTLGIWAPQIIRHLGVSTVTNGWLNAIPSVLSVIAMVWWSRHSDRTGERVWHVIIPCVVAAVGLVLAGKATGITGVVLALCLVNIGISCSKPPLWSMPTMFLSGSAAAAGTATINSIGNLGGFVGPAMIGWLKDTTGSFAGGLYFVAGLLAISAAGTLLLSRAAPVTAPAAEATNS
ncbi:MAG TPA: MFS transporter [Acetobacteraceae bacterium]|nr:MFS transporter [Acetobacteraceae bacterium]